MASLQEEISRSFGEDPAHRPVEERLTAGRRALRRRWAAQMVAGLAAAVLVGGAWTVSGPASQQRGDETSVAMDPTSSLEPQENPSTSLEPKQNLSPAHSGPLAELGPDGLILGDDVTVVRRVENPMGLVAPDQSLGLVVDHDGTRIWMLLAFEEKPGTSGGSSSTYDDAGRTYPTFDLWLAETIAMQQGAPTLALVAFGDGKTLVPEDGVELLEQRASPQMPENFAAPGDRTAVAMVRWAGERWFVLARQLLPESPLQYIPTAASVVGDPTTIDGFLEVARKRYAQGEGLR